MLPRFGELILVLELTRAWHQPTNQHNSHQENKHLAYAVITMPYFIKKILYFTHNQLFNNQHHQLNRVLN
jgi:hypothetical protein